MSEALKTPFLSIGDVPKHKNGALLRGHLTTRWVLPGNFCLGWEFLRLDDDHELAPSPAPAADELSSSAEEEKQHL